MGKHELLTETLLSSGTEVAYFGRYVPKVPKVPSSTEKTEIARTQKRSRNGHVNHKSHMDYHVHNSPTNDPYFEQH